MPILVCAQSWSTGFHGYHQMMIFHSTRFEGGLYVDNTTWAVLHPLGGTSHGKMKKHTKPVAYISILVHSDCCNKIPQTGQLIYFLVLEARSPRSGWWHGQLKALFQVADFLLHRHMVEGARELGGIFYKSTNPIPDARLSWPNHLLKPHLLMISPLGIRIQRVNSEGGTKTFRS